MTHASGKNPIIRRVLALLFGLASGGLFVTGHRVEAIELWNTSGLPLGPWALGGILAGVAGALLLVEYMDRKDR